MIIAPKGTVRMERGLIPIQVVQFMKETSETAKPTEREV
jgi:hypothetical protein